MAGKRQAWVSWGCSGPVPLTQLSPPGPPGPQCYACQSLHKGESCRQVQSCVLPKTCKAIVSSWNAGEGPPGVAGRRHPCL